MDGGGGEFTDVQIKGPFHRWEHRHIVEADGANRCVLRDEVTYELPFGALGRVFSGALARRRLERMFEYRHAVTRRAAETGEAGETADTAEAGETGEPTS
ncbi:MAG: hypothetical protein H7Y88_00905 [Phycisphaerales bacterium]|nr:hypothetical protein [Phycisphaerales bacterium]